MSYTDDYYKALRTQQQKKKKNALSVQSNEDESGLDSYSQGYYNAIAERNNEREQAIDAIAPITVGSLNHSYSAPSDFFESREKDDDDSGLDFFKKSSLFDDGYDFGDITRTILGTAGDVAVNAGKGLVRMGEGVADWMAHGVANIADWTGNDAYADALRESATESFTDKVFGGVDNYLDQASVLGRTSEAILEGVGQAGAIYATGGALGGLGLGATGTTAATTGFMYLSGVGSGIGEAYQAGATDEEAQIYGRISGFADAVSELLFGGLGKGVNALGVSKGLSSADDMLAKTVSNVFKGRLGKNLAEYGIKAGAEGLEEVIAGSMQALGKKMTYLSEKDLADIIADENLLEQFVVGTFSSGIMQGGDVVTSTRAGRDFITNLTKNEQLVVDTEFNNRLQEATKDGKKLTKKQENELYEEVISDLDKGLISTDTIESVLGGEDYKGYSALAEKETSLTERKNALTKEIDALLDKPNPTIRDNERLAAARQELATVEQSLKGLDVDTARNNLHKTISNLVQNDTRLHESFNERARRGEDLQLDVEKYTGAAKTTAENLLKGGLNNTYKVRSFANMVTKLSADTNVVVDVATAKKLAEAGLGVEGRTVNGVKTKDGIIINVESGKKLETIVGHELTHVFEEAGNYEFAQAIKEYAELKGEYQSRYSELERIYSKKDANGNILKDENGNTIFIRDDVNIDAEVVADLVGDYLFTDTDFINNLSTKHRNVFQKIFDEIKYLLKIATAGSEEARKLEEVKKKFEQAYRENVKGKPDTTDTSTNEEAQEFETDDVQYSISVTDNETLDFLNEQISRGEYDAEKNPNGGYYVTYKSMSFWGYDENGNAILRSPMAEYVDGELSNAYLVPKDKSKLNWYKSTETIDENTGFPTGLLVKTKKPGNKSFSYLPASENQDLINEDWSNLYFNLKKKVQKKGKWVDSDVPARYNPYEHSSNSMLNDQFSTAYLRDNLVTVKMYVPVSEDNGTFRAKWSKDPTGWADWKTGTVAGKINKQKDLQRRVFLSRYAAPVEIVSDSEVAQAYKSYIEGTDVAIPDNVVSPGLLAELRKAGVPITESGKVQYSLGYHAGDLGKAEDFYHIVGRGRGTGHFGTGTYFVGDEAQISDSYYGKRPHEKVDFDKYNLFKVQDADSGHNLHRFLKGLNDNILSLTEAKKTFNEYYDSERNVMNAAEDTQFGEWTDDAEVKANRKLIDEYIESNFSNNEKNLLEMKAESRYRDAQEDYVTDYDRQRYERDYRLYAERFGIAENIEEYVAERTKEREEDIAELKTRQVEDWYYTEAYDFLKEHLEANKERRSWYRGLTLGAMQSGIYIGEGKLRNIVDDIYNTVKDYGDNGGVHLDSASTMFMKALGYEGIDVRGIDSLDNVGYGSVIYDLKGEDLARKQEIGTAKYSLSENALDNGQNLAYYGTRGDTYARTDEFRSLQAESQRMSAEEWNFYLRGGENETVRRRISAVLQRQMDTFRSSGGSYDGVLTLSGKGNQFNIYEGVDPSLFHDIFEVSRKYLRNGELVDLHDVETTEDGVGYNDCYNYLSEDGLSGFSITPDGDLISVFNASEKGGFLRAISDVVKARAKTLDCYASPNQNLMEMYQKTFGFKTASVMDYNLEYDHDNIAENHDMPKVAFMVNTETDVELREFGEDEYDEAVAYRNSFVNQAATNEAASFIPQTDDIAPTKYSLSADSDGRELSNAVKNHFANSKVVDENGNLKVVYHGTASGEFFVFDKAKGSVEGDFGSGFYFTDNADDVSEHYEGGGPDFENKVARLAEQIEAEEDIDYAEAEKKARAELFKGSHKFDVYLNIENPAIVGETTLFNPDDYFGQYNEEDYDSYEDYEGDVEQLVVDDVENIIWDIERNVDIYSTDGISEILYNAFNEGGIDIESLKTRINELYLEDNNGNLVGNEVTRQIIESLGYDGIIDSTVSGKWNMNMEEGTTHYIVFKPNQIKSVTNENPTDSPDIRYSLSMPGEISAPYGKFNLYGWEAVKQDPYHPLGAPRTDVSDVAPAPNVQQATAEADNVDVEALVGDKDNFVSKKAMELYQEITSLKKGVRASKQLGYLLDHGYDWRSIKTALLNIRDNPNQVVNPNSAAESVAREMLGREYDNMVAELTEPTDIASKIRINMQNIQTELDNNRKHREQSNADYDAEIADTQAKYDAKKNKNTIEANNLLRRIERLNRLKNTNDANYAKRINDLEKRLEKMSSPTYKTAMQRRAKHDEYTALAKELVGDTSTWKDKKLGLSYKVNTLSRNLRDIVRDENGNKDPAKADAITDEYQGNYNRNEADLKRESKRLKSPFAELGLNRAEETYAHMLGEFRHNPDTKLSEDAVKEYYNKHKKKIDTEKVDKAIAEARKTFDELFDRVNERLREQGMKEIPYRKGYFPHFTKPHQGFLAKLFNWKTVDNEIPTSIAGLTETFNPERSWQSFSKERKADTTDYNLAQALDTYIHGALDWIYHIEDIQKRRALENYIRYVHSEEGVKARIEEIRKNEEYDADEAQNQIDLVYAEARNPLNNFVTDLRAGTNTLASKKSSMDRAIEEKTNRKIYSVMTNLNNRVSANMVVGSISSALTNFIPITQSWTEVSPRYSLRGMKDTIASTIRDDGLVNKSTFLTNRLMNEENLYQTTWDKVSDKAAFLMEAIDSFTSQTVWRSKYLQNISEGMSEAEAIRNADQFAENVIAGRSRGNMPTIFDAKNPITKIFTAFQLEVANQYGYFFKDAPQDAKTKARLTKGYATAFLGAYVYNALYSSLVGRTAAFDPARILEELFRDMGLFGDDDEEEPEDIFLNLTENVIQELPFVGGLLGGGRIPLSSALPYSGQYGGLDAFAKDVSESNWDSLTKEMLKPIYYLAMPMGGGQLKKTIEGLSMFSDEHPISGSYTDSGNLRFPVEETPWNVAQAALFGQYASENARDYFDNGRQPLKEKQIQEFIDVDIPIADYWEYREGLAKQDTLEEKFDYIAGLDLPVAKKNILINNIVDREESVDMTNYNDYSSLDEFDFATKNPGKYAIAEAVGGYDSYTKYTDALGDIHADKDSSGKSINGSRKEKVTAYIESLPLDYGEKIILHKMEYPADDTYNYDIVEYLDSRDDVSYEQMVSILEELGFKVNGQQISWD